MQASNNLGSNTRGTSQSALMASKSTDPLALGIPADIGAILQDDDEGEDEFEALKAAIGKALQSKKAHAAQKQKDVVEEFQKYITAQYQALEAVLNKDAKEGSTAAQAGCSRLQQRLSDRITAMEALTVKYQQDMQQLWHAYEEEVGGIDTEMGSLKAAAEKRKAVGRKKVKAFQDDVAAKLGEVQTKVTKMKQQSGQLPGLARVLKQFVV